MVCKMAMALAVTAAAPALAASADPASSRVLAPFAACRALPDPAQRGVCYDRAFDGLRGGVAAGDVVISDAVRRRAEFGLGSLTVKTAHPAKAAAVAVPIGVNEIDSTIVDTRPYGVDRFTFELADGALWRTTEGMSDPLLRKGTRIHLKRGILGSFLLQPERGRAFKVMRVR